MKQHLQLNEVERQTLTELTIHHPFADCRRRALGLLLLDLGFTPKSAAARLGTTFQSVYNGTHAWQGEGLCGLLGGHQGGRPPKLSTAQTDTLVRLAGEQACYLRELDQALQERHPEAPPVNPQTLARVLKARGLRFRRTRWSLKKSAMPRPLSATVPSSPPSPPAPAPAPCDGCFSTKPPSASRRRCAVPGRRRTPPTPSPLPHTGGAAP